MTSDESPLGASATAFALWQITYHDLPTNDTLQDHRFGGSITIVSHWMSLGDVQVQRRRLAEELEKRAVWPKMR